MLIVVAALALSGCSGLRLGYDHADTVIAFRMNDWFALSGDVEDAAKDGVRRVKAWHRREELPQYAAMLREVDARLADPRPLTAAEVLTMQQRVTQRLLRVGDRVASEFAPVLAGFGPRQRERLAAKIEDSNRDFRKENVDRPLARLRERRLDETIDRYEFWLGRLDRAQRERIRQWIDGVDPDPQGRLAQRLRRQQTFVAIVDAAPSVPQAQTAASLRALFADFDTPADPAARERRQAMLAGWAAMTADLINGATPAQRTRARERLRSMEEDFTVLSREH
ncbi:hypothetical protein GCM10023144_05860 [Pigmentiphaga soli]|uniref:Lipoprotein n=1 Tax=Pigmentiphaga soli TaxID=1007095 RepID=A0ABP8GH81_9BURK